MNTSNLQSKSLNFEQACAYLGYSKSWMYKLTSAGIIPFSKPNGKVLFFNPSELDNWISKNKSSSLADKQINAATYITTNKNTK